MRRTYKLYGVGGASLKHVNDCCVKSTDVLSLFSAIDIALLQIGVSFDIPISVISVPTGEVGILCQFQINFHFVFADVASFQYNKLCSLSVKQILTHKDIQ